MILYELLYAIGIVYLGFLVWTWLEKPKKKYQAPRVIREWILDDPEGGAVFSFYYIRPKDLVRLWTLCAFFWFKEYDFCFLAGDLNEVVRRTMG